MNTLIVIDRLPYGDWRGREALDMAFSLAAFDRPVTLLFRGAGVNWLRPGQLTEQLDQKSVERNLSAAPVFGVSALVAEKTALRDYRLSADQLPKATSETDLTPAFYQQFDAVVVL
ncbi:MAG: DsrE family protein [Marinobacter sp.]|uniref:DsrE family protein n=1 Tax=Marinobacter sp. TaxID=50741 RepID=UPI0034A08249